MKFNYLFKHLVGTFIFFAFIFIGAGRLNYLPGLVYVGIGLVMSVLNYTVFSIDKALLAERSNPGKGVKSWDKKILGLSFLTTLAMFVTAGLDSGRFRASPNFSIQLTLLGVIFTILGQLLFMIAQKQNKYFSSVMRIQLDRGHTVCDTGLYTFVRHPAYLGSIIQSLGFPLLFGSLWSIIPICTSILLLVIRTHLEDQALTKELSGYLDYTHRTRYRLIPYLW